MSIINPIIRSMEVEVKLRLPNYENYKTLFQILSPFHKKTHNQFNNFFDGADGELSRRRAVLRLRLYAQPDNNNNKYVISLKAKARLINGISTVEEDEEELDPKTAEKCLDNPNVLTSMVGNCRIMKRVKEEFFEKGEMGFVGLGGFKNLRNVYEWKGLMIELDQTSYEFGTLYEIECESSEPEKAKELIEEFLKENGVLYTESVVSKFAIFRAGKLP